MIHRRFGHMIHRQFDGGRLIVASHNPGKVSEIKDLLAPFAVAVSSAGDLNLTAPEEAGTTFAANAELKAQGCRGRVRRDFLGR